MSYSQIVTPLYFFQFMANLEQSRCQVLNAWSGTLTFLLTVITKAENKTKILQHSSHTITLSKSLLKMLILCQKKGYTSKIQMVFVLKDKFPESKYACVLNYQTSSLQHNQFQTGRQFYLHHKLNAQKADPDQG